MSAQIDPLAVSQVAGLARKARVAARQLALMSRAAKDEALLALADALDAATQQIVDANAEDLRRGREKGMAEGLLDRLMLDAKRVGEIAQAVRDIAALPDPVGEVVRGSTLANGLQIRQVRVPMGVVGMIYEARPNVTVDAAALGPRVATPSSCGVALRPAPAIGPSSPRCGRASSSTGSPRTRSPSSTVGATTPSGR